MGWDSWTCVMVEQGPGLLDAVTCTALKKAACCLALNRGSSIVVRENHCTGRVETEWRTHQLGARSGVLFRAVVDNDLGDPYRVNFLLSLDDLNRGADIIRAALNGEEDGDWERGTERVPLNALYDFTDLSTPRRS